MLRTQLLSPLLVGRRAELEALEALLMDAASGRGTTALIAGDAGIGKSRLCRELKARAARDGVRVIEGRSSPAESSVPYGPFLDALRFRIARGEGELAAKFLEPVIGRIAPLFTELSELASARSAPEATDVRAAFEGIFRVVQRLAEHGPVLVLLEDIHWADPTSHGLVHYLARRLGDEPLLLIATFRTDELHPGHPVHRLAATLARERVAHRVDLDPLSPPDVRAMVAAMLGVEPAPGFADAVWRRTEGNPLFIEEVLSGLVQTRPHRYPAFDAEDLAEAALPATINDIVLSRIEPLGRDAVEALQVASVIGRRFRFDVLAAALGWPDERLLPVVERAVGHRILIEEQGGFEESYAFRHSLAQEVLYGAAIGRRKRVWHRRVAAALEATDAARGLPHTTLAHHYRLGGDPGRARHHAVLAGDEAARLCAWSDAEAFYEQALAALEQGPRDPALEAEVIEKLAEVAWWQNRASASEQYAQEALELHRSLGDRSRMAALLRRLSGLYAYQHGDTGRSIATLREALAVLKDEAPAERIFLMNDLGRLHLARGEFAEAQEWLERALGDSSRRGDCAEEALSLVLLGRLAILRAKVGTGIARLELARALLEEEQMPVERATEVYHAGIRALEAAREHERARTWVDAALAYATAHGAVADAAIYRAFQAAVDRRAGRWDRALERARAAVDELRTLGRTELREALRVLADVHRVRGEHAAAAALYEEALGLGEEDAAVGLALLLRDEGRPTEAATRMERLIAAERPESRLFALRTLPLLVDLCVAAGRVADARAAYERLSQLARESDYRAGAAAGAHAYGWLAAAEGNAAEAARALEDAVAAWRAMDLPHESARAMLDLAEALLLDPARAGEAAEHAHRAAHLLESLGAGPALERARALLERTAAGRRSVGHVRHTLSPLRTLTPRERDVLLELAQGKTNKQIARALAIRPKTVGNHVSSILAKLDCATRTEASRIALMASGAVASGR